VQAARANGTVDRALGPGEQAQDPVPSDSPRTTSR
jgi:hypothetical protein